MQTWISNHELFPNMNQELLQEILNFKDGDKEKIARFAIKYNLSYLGEIAERWHERNIVNNSTDLRSLIMGLTLAGRENYLYDQEVLFVSSVRQYLMNHWDSVAAAALLNFSWAKFRDPIEASDIFNQLQREGTSSLPPNERVLLISLLSEIVYYNSKNEGLLAFIIEQLEQLEMDLSGSHKNYPLVILLSNAYVQLGKPSSKLFKDKTKAKWLRTLYLLTTNETPTDTNDHTTLGITKEELFSYNYLLSNFETIGNSSITGPGLIRIKRRYLESHFWAETPLPNQVIAQVKLMKEDDLDHLLQSRFVDGSNNPRFLNLDNLKFFLGIVEKKLITHCNPSYILLINLKVLTEELETRIIQKLLLHVGLAQEDFIYLEQLRSLRDIECVPVNNAYTKALLVNGIIAPTDIAELEHRQMVGTCIHVLVQEDRISDLMELLSQCKTHHLKYLLDHFDYESVKAKIIHPPYQKLLYYYLQALYYIRPQYYASIIYLLLEEDILRTLYQLSDEQHHQLEKDLIDSSLLNKSHHMTLVRKHMSDEERSAADSAALCDEIQKTSKYGMKRILLHNIEKFKSTKRVREIYLDRLMSLPLHKSDLSDIALYYQILKVFNVCDSGECFEFEKWLSEQIANQYKIAN